MQLPVSGAGCEGRATKREEERRALGVSTERKEDMPA